MKTTRRQAAIVLAAGLLGLGALAIATPALAGVHPFGPAVLAGDPGPGWRGGNGAGPNNGPGPGAWMMNRGGTCPGLAVTAEQGSLAEQQKSTLAALAQQEKLAHDLYTAFAGRYDAVVFDRIATAETQHLTAIRTLLDRYGLADPTAGRPAGKFSDPAVQADHDRLLAQGQASQAAAGQVARQVEQANIDSAAVPPGYIPREV